MNKVKLSALLILVVLTLSACNRGYGCPYGISTDFTDFLAALIPFF